LRGFLEYCYNIARMNPAPETSAPKEESVEVKPVVIRREPERDLVVWKSPARPFKRRSREFYIKLIAIVGMVSLILFVAEGWMPAILLIALLFLFFIMSTISPEEVEYKITTKGIAMAGKKVEWAYLGRFWFSTRLDCELLIVETANFPGRMEFVVGAEVKEEIKKALSSYLLEEEVSPSVLDKAAGWFSKRLPNK